MHTLLSILVLTIALLVVPASPIAAAEHPDEEAAHLQRRTRSEIRDFLQARAPESLEHLEHAEQEGNEEAAHRFWSEAGRMVGEYYHTREELGEGAAATYLKLRRMEFVADRLTERFHHTSDQADGEAIAKQLRAVLGEHLDATLHLERVHLEHARRELDKAAAELEETAARRAQIINDEYKRRLFGRSEDVDHDHADHHEEKVPIASDAEEETKRLRTESEREEEADPPREPDLEDEPVPDEPTPEREKEPH